MCDECQPVRKTGDPKTRRVIFWLKEHFAEPASSETGRLLSASSGTVKWYNIEIYFYADADDDDDDHLAMGEPVAMALLLAMPMPLRSCLVFRPGTLCVCRVPMPIGQMSKQRKFIIKPLTAQPEWQENTG